MATDNDDIRLPASRTARTLLATTFIVLLLIIAAGLTVALVPYETLKAQADAVSDDEVEFFTPAFHANLQHKLAYGLAILSLLTTALIVFRRRFALGLDRFGEDLRIYVRSLGQAARAAWAELSLWQQLALIGLTLAGVVLRMLYFNDGLEYDESYSYLFFASRPLYVILSYYQAPNNHILYNVFMHGTIELFGASAWAVRLPALIFGVLTIPLTYLLGRRVLNIQTGLFAATLVTASHWMIRYSTQGRGYSLQLLLVLLMALLAFTLIHSRNRAAWLMFALLAALSVHTIPTGVYPVAFLWVWLLFTNGHPLKVRFKYLAIYGWVAVALTLLLYLPVFVVSGPESVYANQYVVAITSAQWRTQMPEWISGFHDYLAGTLPLWLQLVLAVSILVSLVLHPWKKKPWPFIVPLVVVTLALVVIQQVHPFTRVWTWVVPFLAIAAASGFSLLLTKLIPSPRLLRVGGVLVGILLLLNMTVAEIGNYARTLNHRQTYETGMIAAAEWFNTNLEPDDFVRWNMSFPVIGFYLDRYGDGRQVLYSRDETPTGRVFFIHDRNREIPVELAEADLDSSALESLQPVFAKGNMTIHELIR